MAPALILLLALAADDPRMSEHRGGGATAISPDRRWLISHGTEGLHVWEVATGLERALEKGATLARPSPERAFSCAAEGKELVLFESGRFLAWDLASGARLRSVSGP